MDPNTMTSLSLETGIGNDEWLDIELNLSNILVDAKYGAHTNIVRSPSGTMNMNAWLYQRLRVDRRQIERLWPPCGKIDQLVSASIAR